MEEESTRGQSGHPPADTNREIYAPSGWVTTKQAARSLGISPRTVRWHIEQGNIVAEPHGEGVQRTWLVSIDSLQAFRHARQDATELPRSHRAAPEDAAIAADIGGNPIRELADRLAEEAARAAEFRVRLELTEQAQSTLESELAAERQRREEAERERDELRRELHARGRQQEAHDTDEQQQGRSHEPRSATGGAQEHAQRRPWWKRVFRG
jgi:hypothetical protein